MTQPNPFAQVHHDVLALADYAYQRLRDRVAGLTDAEYLWEPAAGCWSLRPRSGGGYELEWDPRHPEPQPLTTVAWRLSHITDLLAADRNATWLGVTPRGVGDEERRAAGAGATAAAAIQALEDAYGRFRGHVSAMDIGTLLDPLGAIAGPYRGDTRLAFILHELDELIHHGAEVGTMRDLYRTLAATR